MNAFLVVDVQNDFISGSLNISNCSAQQNGIEVSAVRWSAWRSFAGTDEELFMLPFLLFAFALWTFRFLISGSHDDGGDQLARWLALCHRRRGKSRKVLKLTSPSFPAYCRSNLDLIEFSVVLSAVCDDKRASQWKPNTIRLHAESSSRVEGGKGNIRKWRNAKFLTFFWPPPPCSMQNTKNVYGPTPLERDVISECPQKKKFRRSLLGFSIWFIIKLFSSALLMASASVTRNGRGRSVYPWVGEKVELRDGWQVSRDTLQQ